MNQIALSQKFAGGVKLSTQVTKYERAHLLGIKKIDFKATRFDGDPRAAVKWVEHFEDHFGKEGLAYLFNPLHPALVRPDHLYQLFALISLLLSVDYTHRVISL